MATISTARRMLPGLRRTMTVVRPHLSGGSNRMLVAGGFIALFAEVAFRLLEPWPLKIVVDLVVAPGAGTRPGLWVTLVLCGLTLVGFVACRALAAYLTTVAFALVGNRVLIRIRAHLFDHLQGLSLRYHQQTKLGDLVTRLTSDVGRLQEVAVTAALPLIGNVVTLVGMSVVMLILEWRLALVALAAFPIFALISSRDSRRINEAAKAQRRREGDLAGTAAEALGAITVVQSYGLEPVLSGRFSASNNRSLRDGVRATRLAAGLERRTDLIVGAATAIVVAGGGYAVLSGQLTPGELVVFISYLKSAFKPMRDLAKYTGRLAKAAASGERIADVLHAVPDIVDAPHARPAPPWRGSVRFEGVHLAYDGRGEALRDINLAVPAGTRIGVSGASGAGKSTLGSLLLRLRDPSAGRVLVDGWDLRDLTVASVRAQIAVVLQESVLFADTIAANIRLGRLGASDAEVGAAARAANAAEFIEALPDGYDTMLGERGATLSGGQRQRIAIARAMLRRAPIIVLDEATTGLDAANDRAVTDALDRLTRGRTTFVISHDPRALASCDLVAVIDHGRLVRVGPPTPLGQERHVVAR